MNRWPYLRRLAFLARRLGVGRNPLRRRTDRTESLVLLAAFLIAAAVVPFAVSIGAVVSQHQVAVSVAQMAQRHQVTAALTEDTPLTVAAEGTNAATLTQGRWTDAHGITHTSLVPAAPGEPAGSHVQIWTDNNGNMTSSPLTADQAQARGIAATAGIMLGVVAALAGIAQLIHTRLNRVRARAWESEWRIFGPRWTTRTN